jgi:uncharacterized membrane protein HdeD (DUF308 family)
MISKKGGKIHVTSGKLYMYAMWIVVITAGLLCIENYMYGNINSAIFLGFLVFLTGAPLWYAINIVKHKKPSLEVFRKKKFYLELIIVLYGTAMLIYGFFFAPGTVKILMYIFGILGLTGLPKVIKHLMKKTSPYNWIQEHAIGMITTGIAAYTAFLVFGGQNFFGNIFTGYYSIILWTAPGLLGTIANFYYSAKLRDYKK